MAHILLVDDDRHVLSALRRQLVAQGHQVTATDEVGRGLIELAAGGIDILITDHRIGPDSGLDLLRGAADFSPTTCSVVISGNIQEHERLIARELGAVAILEKPFSPRDLTEALTRCMHDEPLGPATLEPATPAP